MCGPGFALRGDGSRVPAHPGARRVLAGNYIKTYNCGDISVKNMRPGDVVSLNCGGYYGHVLVLLAKFPDVGVGGFWIRTRGARGR